MTDAAPPAGAPSAGPLAGLVVCDLSTVLAGPYCTMLLGDLGAEVIKVEPPDGDPTHGYGPPMVSGSDGSVESTYYLSINRNKRGLRLDLRRDEGREVLERLLARSDVLVENQRPGGLARLGFPAAEIERRHARLVHLSITGFGPDGPLADRPGFDFVIQAMAGLMSITGASDEDGGGPTKVGVAITDIATGMLGAVAVLAALLERGGSGRGQRIDLSLFESTIAWLANQASGYLIGGQVPTRMGNRHPSITPYETFRTADGEIAIAVGSERQWQRLCGVVARPELAADARFATNPARVANRAALRPLLEEPLAAERSAIWLERLDAAGVPCSPINDLAAVFAEPQTHAREMVREVEHPSLGTLRLPGIPFKLARTPGSIRRHPPSLGEHTDEILASLGYDAEQVRRLRAASVV